VPKFAWRAKRQSPTANAALRVSLAAPSSSCTAVSPDMGMKAGWGWLQPAQIPGDNSWGSYGAGHALAALGASFLRHLRAEQVLRQHRFCSSCHRTQRARLLPSQVKAPFPWRNEVLFIYSICKQWLSYFPKTSEIHLVKENSPAR